MSDEDDVCLSEGKSLVKEIVQAIMVLDYSKKPFKQADITSHLSQKIARKMWNPLFDDARKSLKCLGLELHETNDTNTKMYFVVSKNRPLATMFKYASEEEISNRILLTFVLAYIFMKNGTVVSDELLNHLKDLNIYDDSVTSHPYFGNVKKILHEFVDQLYLSSTKIPDSDLFKMSWGQRAEVEISKRAILEFVCKCGYNGKMKPENLVSHYEKVLQQEAQENASDNCINDIADVSSD